MSLRGLKQCIGQSISVTEVVLIGVRERFVAVFLVVCLGFGCKPCENLTETPSPSHWRPFIEAPTASGQTDEDSIPRGKNLKFLQVFSGKTFYLERPEPEEVIIGVLQVASVRGGPNTRDMPFKLVVGQNEYSVYVAGFGYDVLRPYVGYEVEVVGKRIDQRTEGYGIEIWIATVSTTFP